MEQIKTEAGSRMGKRWWVAWAVLSGLMMATMLIGAARAEEPKTTEKPFWSPESGKLLATAGVTTVEGQGGGGLVPWALISGYGTRDAVGANAHGTMVYLPRFSLYSAGATIGLYDRVELSVARQWFDTRATGARLGLGAGYTFGLTVAGAKVRLFGDAVYDQDSWVPQVAVGLQYKTNNRGPLVHALGARSADGVDFYVSATKLFLAQSLLLNATVRATRANQFGLLGFGGDRNDGYSAQFEGSAAYLWNRNLAFGAEYRRKPDNLRFAREDSSWDVFAAWFLNKNLSATLAYVDLGHIAGQSRQGGVYLSLQGGF